MGNRLTQIATRTGDDGTTGLGDNTRVSKNSRRPHAMGDVDELNSHIGLLLFAALSLGHGTAAWAYSAEPGRKAQALRAWQPDTRPAPERQRPDGDGAPIPSA